MNKKKVFIPFLVFIIVIAAMFAGFYRKSKSDFRTAQEYDRKMFFYEASGYYEKVIRNIVSGKILIEESLTRLAEINDIELGDKKKAALYYELYYKKFPSGKNAERFLYLAGYTHITFTGDLKKAEEAFDRFIEKYGESKYLGAVYQLRGDSYRKRNDYGRAIKNNLILIEKKDETVNMDYIYLTNAEMYYRQGNNPAAIKSIEKIKNRNMNMVKYNIIYNRLLTLKTPGKKENWKKLSEAYVKNGFPEEARAALLKSR